MTRREKVMVSVVGGAVLLVVNIFVLNYFFGTLNKLQRDSALRKAELQRLQAQVAEAPLWTERENFLQEHLPVLENEALAGSKLLDQVQGTAKKLGVLTVEPSVPGNDHQPLYTGVRVAFKTKSKWRELVQFLHELQSPSNFVAVSHMTLAVDTNDPTQMRGDFEVMKLFAPK